MTEAPRAPAPAGRSICVPRRQGLPTSRGFRGASEQLSIGVRGKNEVSAHCTLIGVERPDAASWRFRSRCTRPRDMSCATAAERRSSLQAGGERAPIKAIIVLLELQPMHLVQTPNLKSTLLRLVPARIKLRKAALREHEIGEKELRLLPLLCRPDAIAIDVGANRGVYAFYMRRYAAGVVAIEANSKYARFIRSALPKVKVFEAAASDHVGQATLRIPLEIATEGMATIEPENRFDDTTPYCTKLVALITLDSANLKNVGFIKIDVEGHELASYHSPHFTKNPWEQGRLCVEWTPDISWAWLLP
jgi:FkbM family methyltransferase